MSAPTVLELPPAVREAFCVREALRRLGFPADELSIVWATNGLFVQLSRGPGFVVGPILEVIPWAPLEVLHAELLEAASAWNTAPDADLEAAWDASLIVEGRAVPLILALAQKGIALPETECVEAES